MNQLENKKRKGYNRVVIIEEEEGVGGLRGRVVRELKN